MATPSDDLRPDVVRQLFDGWMAEGVGIVVVRRTDASPYIDKGVDGPLRKLLLSVLLLGIRDYLRLKKFEVGGLPASSRYFKREAKHGGSADDWIFSSKPPEHEQAAFMSFDNVCFLLGLDANIVRDRLQETRPEEAKEILGLFSRFLNTDGRKLQQRRDEGRNPEIS